MKEAIVFPLPYTSEELPMYTRSRAMTAGWMFTIPVQTRTGNGYIYDSDYITREQAQAEVEQVLGHPIEVARHIRFDPGCVDRAWIDNCCAVGLSASFVEPLEATSIGTTIQQMFLLINRLPDATPASQARYNQSVQDIMTNIRDFVLAHYRTPRRDTEFWRAQSQVELPASLAHQLDYWRTNLPQAEDFAGVSPYVLFKEANWTQVLWGLDHFDQAAIQTHYEMTSEQVRAWVEDTYRFIHPEGPDDRAYVTHRQFIDRVCGAG
jgi:tryptophan halogenase